MNSNGWISEKVGEDWIFKKDQSLECLNKDSSQNLRSVLNEELSILNTRDGMSEVNVDVDNVVGVFINLDDDSLEKASMVVEAIENNYRCMICGFLSSKIEMVYNHLEPAHGDEWKQKDYSAIRSRLSKPGVVQESQIGNVHTDPNWSKNLKKSFLDEVVPNWSKKTRDAWVNNEEIMDKSKFRQVRAEIKDSLVDHIVRFFGTTKTPSLKVLTEIVKDVLSASYPFMFSQVEGSASTIPTLNFGRGLGGVKGVLNLPSQLWDSIYNKQIKLRTVENSKCSEDSTAVDLVEPARPRKGKKPHRQGKIIQLDICNE